MRTNHTRATAVAATVAALAAGTLSAPAQAEQAAAAPDIDVAAVTGHLQALQSIADENGGSRATGEPGYRASVDYVTQRLEAAGYTVREQSFDTPGGESWNITADLVGADPTTVVMAGGHLDSVSEGPGINDNGSGSAAELATAEAFAASGTQPAVTVRFSWWGAEEDGLLGSTAYVDSLDQAGTDQISSYLNVDMLGSPNGGYFVYEDDGTFSGLFSDFLAARGVTTAPTSVGGRSDHAAFEDAGIAVGGLFSGAEETKTQEEADLWGGTAGEAYDACYHAACDSLDNIDPTMLDNMTDALSSALWSLSSADAAGAAPDVA